MQSVLSFRTTSMTPLFQIWLFGKEAEGELKRPFRNLMQPAPPVAKTEKEVKAQEKKAAKKKSKKE